MTQAADIFGSCRLFNAMRLLHIDGMTDNAGTELRERMARLADRAIARIHENRPELRGKSLEETVMILKEEERRTRIPAAIARPITNGPDDE